MKSDVLRGKWFMMRKRVNICTGEPFVRRVTVHGNTRLESLRALKVKMLFYFYIVDINLK